MSSRRTANALGLRGALSVLIIGAGLSAADAETAVFPGSSAFGVVPPDGFEEATDFSGFIAPTVGASILIAQLPPGDFDQFQASFTSAALATRGIVEEARRPVDAGTLDGTLIIGHQIVRGVRYEKCMMLIRGTTDIGLVTLQVPTEAAYALGPDPCSILLTIKERPRAGLASRLADLPFELTEFGRMRRIGTIGGNVLALTIGPKDVDPMAEQPMLVVARSIAPKPDSVTVEEYSRQLAKTIAHVSGLQIMAEQSVNIAGALGHEIVGLGMNQGNSVPISVVQWTRFEPDGSYIRILGIVRAADRESAFGEFRKIRDGLRIPSP